MYHNYFGLEESAFSIAVNPRYLYMSRQHKEALAHLLYGVKGGGFVMLSGEVGTGKTTIIRCLLEQLPDNTDIAIVLNPMADAVEILGTICDELGITYAENASIKVLTDLLHKHFLENYRKGRNTVLLIDEAQLLAPDVLEQIRLLTNLETNTEKLLQIVLVGQPELNTLLAQPRLRQLSQRITARFHLKPLTVEETWSYVNHRLKIAGMQDHRNPFSPNIVKQIHASTQGIPRKINILCERVLMGAYGQNQPKVSGKILKLAEQEVTGPNKSHHDGKPNLVLWKSVAIVCFTALIILTGFIVLNPQPEELTPVAASPDPATKNPPAPADTKPVKDLVLIAASVTNESKPAGHEESAEEEIEDIPPKEPDPAPALPSQPSFVYPSSIAAQVSLFKYLSYSLDENSYPCWQLAERNIECKRRQLTELSELRKVNRPAVLTLNSENEALAFALISELNGGEAVLLDKLDNRHKVSLDELGAMWTGEIFYVWNKPKGFSNPIAKGQRSGVVRWIAQQFALMDSQNQPLTNNYYSEILEKRVKIFQRNHELEDDGIIGEQTLMKLNDKMGIDKTLVAAADE